MRIEWWRRLPHEEHEEVLMGEEEAEEAAY